MRLKDTLLSVIALSLIGGLGLLLMAPERLTQAPDITLTTLQGKEVEIGNLLGVPVLINFWATTCPSCLEEIPHLIELHRELAPRGFQVIGIAMPYDPPNRVVELSRARQIPYPITLDVQGDAVRAFGNVSFTPSSFLIAPDGRIVHHHTGQLDTKTIRSLVLEMLAESPYS